jgi:hypothetical protein
LVFNGIACRLASSKGGEHALPLLCVNQDH